MDSPRGRYPHENTGLSRAQAGLQSQPSRDRAARGRLATIPSSDGESLTQDNSGFSNSPYEPRTDASQPEPRRYSFAKRMTHSLEEASGGILLHRRSSSGRRGPRRTTVAEDSLTARMDQMAEQKDKERSQSIARPGAMPRPVGGSSKLGTFSGVFVPTTLNVLSILMFLRFGMILGQSGVVGMMGMLIAAYIINLVTTLSISAIATNGTVRGGGAYYLISRSLGPEFGGSIGVVFYLGFVFNTGMNAVGLVDCLKHDFGTSSGDWANWLPEGRWWDYLWATMVMIVCTGICLAGSGVFARASNGLLTILLIATFSIPLSSFVVSPFRDAKLGIHFTGLSLQTLKNNLLPHFTKHAAGSQLAGRENFQDLFGILFPATGGIFA